MSIVSCLANRKKGTPLVDKGMFAAVSRVVRIEIDILIFVNGEAEVLGTRGKGIYAERELEFTCPGIH